MVTEPADAPKGCVCYIINNGYLLPALVSASQARCHTPASVADVVIVVIDEPHRQSAVFDRAAKALGVEVIYARAADIDHMHIMFGRFFLDRLLPEKYSRIAYVDGDTQVDGDLSPLFEAPLDPGRLFACRDPAQMFAELSPGWRRQIESERAAIGYEGAFDRYFNSGVLVADSASWPELSRLCLDLTARRGQSMKYPDQDILNLAVGERCELISNRWNFPGFLIGSPAERVAEPRIVHFMSNPRPWTVAAAPWGARRQHPYKNLLSSHPDLEFLKPARSLRTVMRYQIIQSLKMMIEYRAVGRLHETKPDLEF